MADKTLLLLRHAQALAGHPLSNDIARPLSPDGHSSAAQLGGTLVRQQLIPDLVICSSARRARETWEGLSKAFDELPPVHLAEALYGASPQGLLKTIKAASSEANRLLVIAHNPGIGALARCLAGPSSDPLELEKMRYGYGPGDLTVFSQPGCPWREFTGGQSRLLRYLSATMRPDYPE